MGEGSSDNYTVALVAQPTSEVTVDIRGHAGTDLTPSPTRLTFNITNWASPQTVAVTAAQDDDAADDTSVALTHAASGGGYGEVDARTVTVTITEDDETGVAVTPAELSIEEGGAKTYNVVLETQPSDTVTIKLGGTNGTDVSTHPDELTFNRANWQTPRTVEVTAAEDDDGIPDGDVAITHAVTGGDYEGVEAGEVVVTIMEHDTPGVTVSPTELTVGEGDGTGATYTVILDTQPSGDVTVAIAGHGDTDLTLSAGNLIFTPENWGAPQRVTVTAGQDDDAVPDTVTLSHDASGGDYGGVSAHTVEVTIDEDDTARITVNPTALTVTEGNRETYTVILDTQPTGDVTVTVSGAFRDGHHSERRHPDQQRSDLHARTTGTSPRR